MPAPPPLPLWAPQAWLPGTGWCAQVLLQASADGRWQQVQAGVARPPPGAQVLPGPALPGLVNAHSHAFQRAFAGLAERRDSVQDDFWSWRDRMYGVACASARRSCRRWPASCMPSCCRAATPRWSSSTTCTMRPTASPTRMPWPWRRPLAAAAQATGIGLTLLPVLYQRAGFSQPRLRGDQRRFATTPEQVLALRDGIRAWGLPWVDAGVALHSLRAASPEGLQALARAVADDPGPIHIHIAEQTAEVSDCLAATGQRPIAWLADHCPLDARWQLVHATHSDAAEMDAVAVSGAGLVICPSTEANMGDGVIDLPGWWQRGVPGAIGSDQPCVARLAGRAARAGIQPALAAAPAQCGRRAAGRPARNGRALVHRKPAGRRRRRWPGALGPAARRPCRPAGDRWPGPGPAGRAR